MRQATTTPDVSAYPRASNRALLGLLGSLVVASVRGTGRERVLHTWISGQRARHGTSSISVRLPFRQLLLVTDSALSKHVLAGVPGEDGYVEGSLKRSSMAYLAPRALTISHGDDWRRRREFNEGVLWSDASGFRTSVLRAVEDAFIAPVASPDEIRDRMRRVMREVVVGENAPRHLVDDIDTLIGVVQNPVRRSLLGWRYRGRRRRFFAGLRDQRQEAPATSLLGIAASREGLAPDEALEQAPHWMFPFAGSASDLLLRTLAIVGSRPDVARRIENEAASSGAPESPESIDRLAYLESCVLEAGRLFPPVVLTSHTPPNGDTFEGHLIPPGTEVVHYFPFTQRDGAPDSDVHHFRPERLDTSSNLFLSGPRACPGRDLILFVLKSAVVILLTRHRLSVVSPSLRADPLPLSFPERELRLSRTGADRPEASEEAGMTERHARRTKADVLRLSQKELDALYREVREPGTTPTGDTQGTVLALPGTAFGAPLRALARLLVWQGKVFAPASGDLKNKVTPLRLRSIRALVYAGDSSLDRGGEATIIDYSKTSFVARFIRDEIREVGPHLWLGKVFVGKWHAIDFLLED